MKNKNFWQRLKARHEQKQKPLSDQLGLTGVFGIFLRTLKLLSNFAFILLFFASVFGAGIGIGYIGSLFDKVDVPTTEVLLTEVSALTRESIITYSNAKKIDTVNTDLLRTPIEGEMISDNLKQAVIATEDENYWHHNGVVPKAVIRAALGSAGFGSSSGGSTLTQQLIKQQMVGDAPTFSRKASEIIYALELERLMDKEQILTTYLNVSSFGRNNQGRNIAGVEEAAQGIFGVPAANLTIPQAAFIAGLPQSPIIYSPYYSDGSLKSPEDMAYGLNREKAVLFNMYRAGYLTEEEYQTYLAYDVSQDFLAPAPVVADTKDYLYYAVVEEAREVMYDYLIERDKVSAKDLENDETVAAYRELARQVLSGGGLTIKTTIDEGIYTAMQAAAANYGHLLDDGTGYVQMGNVLMDNATGAILGFVGGRDYASNQNNHALDTVRSPGSSIKPILAYGVAIDQGLMGSASILSNYPMSYASGEPIMHVGNSGTAMMTLQEAINTSWNIPAYWTYQLLREKNVDVQGYMEKMNYDIVEYNIESLPLGGGIEVSVAQHTNGYQTLANGGVYEEKHMIQSILDSHGNTLYEHQARPIQVYSPAAASITNELLKGVITSGMTTTFANNLRAVNPNLINNVEWIGKTGTSNDYVDAWLMLATRRMSLGSWIGHDDNTSLGDMTGYSRHGQYVAQLINAIDAASPGIWGNEKFTIDTSATKSNVLVATGQKPGSVEVGGVVYQLSGHMTPSYWASKEGAPNASYRFAIGGTDADYVKAWSAVWYSGQVNRSWGNTTTTRRGN